MCWKRKKVSPLLTFRQISPTMAPSSGHLSAFYHYVGLHPLERARNVIKGKIWTTMLPTVAIIAKRFPPSNSQNAQNVGNKFMGLQSNSSSYTWESCHQTSLQWRSQATICPQGNWCKKHLRTTISFKVLFSLADFAKKMIKDKKKRKKIHFLRHQKSPYDAGP